jgi:glycolate oxidase iron-sulfur subunit
MRRNIDAWWPHVEAGVEAIVVTASGCGVQVRDYGHALADDAVYAEKAAKVSELCRDPAEIIWRRTSALLALLGPAARTRQAGLPLAVHAAAWPEDSRRYRRMLSSAGYTDLTRSADGHLCCGSAGTYSVLQPELSGRLRDNKLAALSGGPHPVIATANIGCLTHLQAGSVLPVRHWIELIDEVLA